MRVGGSCGSLTVQGLGGTVRYLHGCTFIGEQQRGIHTLGAATVVVVFNVGGGGDGGVRGHLKGDSK